MGSLGVLFGRQTRYVVAAIALLLAMLLPTLVGAAQITSRSVELSSASAQAQAVTYKVSFTPKATAGAFVVDFCSNSPLIGEPCTAPTGMDVTGASSVTSGFTTVSSLANNTVLVTGSMTADTPVSVNVDDITNPTDDGTVYARILTYTDATDAGDYTATDPDGVDNTGGPIDEGGVAFAITDTTSVSGAVLETLQFCVSGATITANCASAASTAPVLRLGEDLGNGVVALQPGTISEGDIFTQISTNAVSGAVVSLRSGNTCGGLARAGESTCDIAPATTAVTGESATFGMKIAADTDPTGVTPSGTYQIYATSGYNASDFLFNYAGDNTSGVTSTYGDKVLDTDSAPVYNKNMKLTFGASANVNTPAGNYATDLSLIATGTF
jgi:hypothetical protein